MNYDTGKMRTGREKKIRRTKRKLSNNQLLKLREKE